MDTLTDALLGDPMSETTRRERRSLLLVSFVGVAMTMTGLIPTQISSLGLEFGVKHPRAVSWLLLFIVFYLLCAFVLYGYADYRSWQARVRAARTSAIDRLAGEIWEQDKDDFEIGRTNTQPEATSDEERDAMAAERIDRAHRRNRGWASVRALFEFVFPTILGGAATVELLRAALGCIP